jgi:hypothetical protein
MRQQAPEPTVTALTKILFPLPDYRRTPLTLLRWWESRRLTYNLFVGGAGVVSLTVMVLVSSLPPRAPGLGFAWWGGVLVYGVAANVGYTMGWLAEVGMRVLWGEEAPLAGPAMFRQGLSFAVGLTLLPVPVALFSWVVRLVAHFF